MATPEEVFSSMQAQEPATGGRRSPEQVFASLNEPTVTVGGEEKKKPITGGFLAEMTSFVMREEPGIDYQTGIDDFGFRAKLSRADTEQERINVLRTTFGEGSFSKDRFGAYVIKPEGLNRIGIQADKPRAIDEKGLSFNDLADLSGDAPAIAAGTAAGMATAGTAAIPAMALVGGATALGKAVGEGAEFLAGENLQSAGEVATDVAKEGALGATGEGVFRTILGPLGRKILAPEAKRMTGTVRELTKEARAEGLKPSIMQISKPPIIGRTLSIADRIFGDPTAEQNSRALNAWVNRLRSSAGPKSESAVKLGEDVKETIRGARKSLGKWAKDAYGNIDAMTNGAEIVPTQRLKVAAKEYLDQFPRAKSTSTGAQESENFLASFIGDKPRELGEAVAKKKGRVTFVDPAAVKSLQDIMSLPDKITTGQMQSIRTQLFDAVQDNTLVPGFDSKIAKKLGKEASETFRSLADSAEIGADVGQALKLVDKRYGQEIKKFKSAFVQRLVKDEQFAGSIDPELIVDAAFQKGRSTNIKRIMQFLPEQKRGEVRRAAMDDILDNIMKLPDEGRVSGGLEGLGFADPKDPLTKIFDGKKLLRALDSYGKETLNEMFGKQRTAELYKLGRVTEFMTEKQGQFGGLVAAGIATRPLQNIGRLVKLNAVSHILSTDTGIKWLTDGFAAPNLRKVSSTLSRFFTQIVAIADDNTQSNDQALEIN